MELIHTFNKQVLSNIFNILVHNKILGETLSSIFENTFINKTKGTFFAHTSLCVIKMEFTGQDKLKLAIDPLTDLNEYPKLAQNINQSLIDIQNFFANNFTVKDVKDTNTRLASITIEEDVEFSKDFKEVYDKFLKHNLQGFVWDNLNALYKYTDQLINKISSIEKLQKQIIGYVENDNNLKDENMYKTLTRSALEEITIGLVKQNGSTTNLDIKNALRVKGYWATQQLVSDQMQEFLDDTVEIYSANNGQYNTYHLNTDDDDDIKLGTHATGTAFLPPATSQLSSQQKTNVKTRQAKGSFNPPKPLDPWNTKHGDWEVSSTNDSTILFYDGLLTREQARFSYHKKVDINYHNTRSKKIK